MNLIYKKTFFAAILEFIFGNKTLKRRFIFITAISTGLEN